MGYGSYACIIFGVLIKNESQLELVKTKFNIGDSDLSQGQYLDETKYYIKSYDHEGWGECNHSIVLKETLAYIDGKPYEECAPLNIHVPENKDIEEFKKWIDDIFNGKLKYSLHVQAGAG